MREETGRSAMNRPQGFTIIELMVTIVVLAILLSMAIPSFQSMIERRRLIGAAEAVYSDLQFAKSEALKKNINITAEIGDGDDCEDLCPTGWCFKVAEEVTACGFSFPGVSTTSVFSVTFNHVRGTASNKSVTFSLGANQVKVSVSILGRIMICVPPDAPMIGGYRLCSS